ITDSKGVNGYYVYRATTPGGQTSTPETDFWIRGTSYVDTKITSGTTYYYIVRPVLGDNSFGTASNEVGVSYQRAITLKATLNTGNVTLEWNAITDSRGINGYYVYKATTAGGQSSLPETDFWIKGTSYVDTKVAPGTTYYYIVKPVYGDRSIGMPSNEVAVSCQKIYGTIQLTVGNAIMLVNGKLMEIDPGRGTAPVLKDARTMLPIRAVIEAMGGTVDFISGEQKLIIRWNGKTVYMWIGKTTITVDGVNKTIDVAPYYSDTGRTLVPMRFVLENLGCAIDWDGNTQTAIITYLLNSGTYYPPTPPETTTTAGIWAGVWYTSLGKLTINQNGIYITGSYGGSKTIEGVISGNTVYGVYTDRGCMGGFEFQIASDGQRFDGCYGSIEKQKRHWCEWDGKRESDPLFKYLKQVSSGIDDFSGIWDTDIGRMHITQNGSSVTATYKDNGVIRGTVSSNKLTGTFQLGKATGTIEIYLLDGNRKLIGHFGSNDTARQDWREFDGEKEN
ncbi:MAG: stalk domain-containing protein, partial [Clostridia bacterium]|nr:stalk domain-containing protein [Clostridia bacterium]